MNPQELRRPRFSFSVSIAKQRKVVRSGSRQKSLRQDLENNLRCAANRVADVRGIGRDPFFCQRPFSKNLRRRRFRARFGFHLIEIESEKKLRPISQLQHNSAQCRFLRRTARGKCVESPFSDSGIGPHSPFRRVNLLFGSRGNALLRVRFLLFPPEARLPSRVRARAVFRYMLTLAAFHRHAGLAFWGRLP